MSEEQEDRDRANTYQEFNPFRPGNLQLSLAPSLLDSRISEEDLTGISRPGPRDYSAQRQGPRTSHLSQLPMSSLPSVESFNHRTLGYPVHNLNHSIFEHHARAQLRPIRRLNWGGHSSTVPSSDSSFYSRTEEKEEESARIRGLLERYSIDACKEELEKLVEMVKDKHTEWMAIRQTLSHKLATGEATDAEHEEATRLQGEFETGKEFVTALPKALANLQELLGIMASLDEQKRHTLSLYNVRRTRSVIIVSKIPEAFHWDRVLACGQREEFAEFPVKPEWMDTHLCLRLLREDIKAPAKFCVFPCLDEE